MLASEYFSNCFYLQIVDDLFELMSRCMFQAPLAEFRDSQLSHEPMEESSPQPDPQPVQVEPFRVDPVNQSRCRVEERQDGTQTSVLVEGTGSSGYAMGVTALTGMHKWEVRANACLNITCTFIIACVSCLQYICLCFRLINFSVYCL